MEDNERGPWITSLPAMITALRTDVPLSELGELRTDLVSMALLADRYARLVEEADPDDKHWDGCTDPASPEGNHKRSPRCLFCGGRP